MKILFTICARKGSKGLKNKNISEFLGYPICYYTLSAYQLFKKAHSDYECFLALNTDSTELVEQVKSFGEEYMYVERTDELAGDRVGKIDVIRDTYIKTGETCDYIMDLDLTSPLRTKQDIEGVLNELVKSEGADLSFSVTTSRRSPYFNQVKKQEDGYYNLVYNMGAVSRQQAPVVFDMNASIYAYRPEFLLNAKKLFDGKAVTYEMKDSAVLDIDNPEDKDLMQIVAKYFYENYSDYNEILENIKTTCC